MVWIRYFCIRLLKFIPRHTIVARNSDIPSGIRPSVHTSFSDNSYSFHRITLNLDGQLDHEVILVQLILFCVYGKPNFDTLFKEFLDLIHVSSPFWRKWPSWVDASLNLNSSSSRSTKFSSWWSKVDLWPFYGKVKFALPYTCMGKMLKKSFSQWIIMVETYNLWLKK